MEDLEEDRVFDVDDNTPHNNGPLKIWYFKNAKLVNNLYSGWHFYTSASPIDVANDKYKLELVRKNVLKYTFPTSDNEFMQDGKMYEQSDKAENCYYEEIENLKQAYREEIQTKRSLQMDFVYYRLSKGVSLTRGINSPKSVNGLIKMDIVPMKKAKRLNNGTVTVQAYAALSWNVILEGSEKPLGSTSKSQHKSNADIIADLFGFNEADDGIPSPAADEINAAEGQAIAGNVKDCTAFLTMLSSSPRSPLSPSRLFWTVTLCASATPSMPCLTMT